VVIPIVLVILTSIFIKKNSKIHMGEAIYHSSLNFLVIIIFFISWYILNSRLKQFSTLPPIVELQKRLKVQMMLYIVFFFLRAVFLLIPSTIYLYLEISQDNNKILHLMGIIIYFLEPVFGDCPLVWYEKIYFNLFLIFTIIIN
jgi:hypothetical protein